MADKQQWRGQDFWREAGRAAEKKRPGCAALALMVPMVPMVLVVMMGRLV